MASIDVSRFGGNPIPALKKLKRIYERQNSTGGFKSGGRHIKQSVKNRQSRIAAKKRSDKQSLIEARHIKETSRRNRHLTIKQIMALLNQ